MDAIYKSVGQSYFHLSSWLKDKHWSYQEVFPLNSSRLLLLASRERHVTNVIYFLTPVLYIIQIKLHIGSQYFRILNASRETGIILSSLHNRATEVIGVSHEPAYVCIW
jgi:hypothetical protein